MGWDEVGVAAARAVQQSHLEHKPFVVSMDGNDAAYDLIRDGTPLVLTVAYDVRGMGVEAVKRSPKRSTEGFSKSVRSSRSPA